jgi:hypothetical protein
MSAMSARASRERRKRATGDSTRRVECLWSEFLQEPIEVVILDVDEVAAFQVVQARPDPRAQGPKLQRVFLAASHQQAQRTASLAFW